MGGEVKHQSEGTIGGSVNPKQETDGRQNSLVRRLYKNTWTYWVLSTAILALALFYFAVVYSTQSSFSVVHEFLAWTYICALFAYVFAVYTVSSRRVATDISVELDSMVSNSLAIKSLVRSLRRRARSLRSAARFTLFLTFLSIAAGLYLFTSAGQIASRDTYSSVLADELKRSSTDAALSSQRVVDQLRDLYEKSGPESTQSNVPEELIKAGREIAGQHARTEQIIARIEQAAVSKDTLYFFLSTLTTRIGSVLLLIFLVQILLSVYRYSVRLETYYDSRADALVIYGGSSEEQLERLVSVLSPDKIEFGKTPTTPTEHAVEAVKNIAAIRK